MADRVAIFVDGANMFYAQKANGWHIDFRKVRDYFSVNREIYGAFYFTATPPVDDLQAVRKYRSFRGFLISNDWTVIDKEVKVIVDKATGQRKLKGNLDIEVVFRMLTSAEGWDIGYLLGGDSDYLPILEHLANLGKKIIVVARRETTAVELINVAHQFIDLNAIRGRIEREDRPK
jgi:uncharacterized LabA/DUF88 family protein